ncbi:two-component regulator propeller domain-containing protein [Flavitalea sp. BT771]|uniref:two-component regulator propeller domain-containing protein n=1 Tax=Flavitalea sp. BT771 TaxID=3063329 RepID=UPI0026E21641|nr:two-component regulator propeller domain-containing protein [Flavitalea sp. BT771]MDO6430289.1 two-component regulator propeller domain-containing protein [Flavitalea sp. BT771]MDV6219571.1 two-component regulator propeller domain-containing protein [Flavitalea sp. BT771]
MKFAIYLYSFCWAVNCFASDTLSVRYLGIDQGLSNNAVTCIHKDHNGFMWFGTYDGLNRYDRYSFRIFRNIIGDTSSLSDNHVFCINSDKENKIWTGGGKGVSIYDPCRSAFFTPRFRKVHSPESAPLSDAVLSIENAGSSMLVGTAHSGLIVYSDSRGPGEQIALPGGAGATYNVPAIEYDSIRHRVWVFVSDLGLYKYDLQSRRISQVASGLTQCISLFSRSDGEVFVGNDSGVFRLGKNIFTRFDPVPEMTVRDIAEDQKGALWIATDGNGLWYLPSGGSKALPFLTGDPINSNSIYDLHIDAEGREWIGTLRGGVNILERNSSLFKTISYHNGRTEDESDFILSFCEDDRANLWIGTDGAGLRYWNRQENNFTKYVHSQDPGSISSNFITYITRDYKNDIWISTWFGGINKLSRSGNAFSHYSCYNPVQRIDERNVWQMYEDKKKRLWACASNKGHLYLYDRLADKFELFDSSLSDFQVLTEDRSGDLWGGNYNSLIKLDTEKKKHEIFFIGYPVRSIHEDKDHNFWVGTEGGGLLLFHRETGKFQQMTTKEGLPNNAILRILEDGKGDLWLSTYYGLCRFNPALRIYRNFTQADGLQSNQFSFNAALISGKGEFLFGGIKGFNIFYPDSVYDKRNIPRLFLTGLRIDNAPVETETTYVTSRDKDIITSIRIPFDKAILSFDFTALQYSNADHLKYAYYLKGWDKDWGNANNVRTANYSHLREGTYKFYVRSMNADGVWNDEVQLLSVTVLPPWYRTWWAYLLCLAILMGAVYGALYYYRRQERLRYEIRLALVEKQKEKELTERKIAFFTDVSHEFRTPLTLIVNPLQDLMVEAPSGHIQKKLLTVHRNARRLLSLVDQLLLFRKVESIEQQLFLSNFDMIGTCDEVFLSFAQRAASKNISFSFEKPSNGLFFCGDKQKIEIILFNLLSNALKYTPAGGKVELSVTGEEDQLCIVVRDSGCGIAKDISNRLFEAFYQASNADKASHTGFGIGLYVSKKLAAAHAGELSYVSTEGKGTTFTLSLPRDKTASIGCSKDPGQCDRASIVHELVEEVHEDREEGVENKSKVIDRIISGLPTMVIVDDDAELRSYIKEVFSSQFNIYETEDGKAAFDLITKEVPDIVISDVVMGKMDGIELCRKVKENASLAHIPIILLTGSSSEQSKLMGLECGAEDYVSKPFSKELIVARVQNILRSRSRLQQYFFNTITLQPTASIEGDQKKFLERCIEIVEQYMDNPDFSVQIFCQEIGMSHPTLYKRIKAISGLTINVFIRYLRLRKAAELLINTSKTIVEVTYITGFNDLRYFREQFSRLFGMTPSEFIRRYRKPLGNKIIKDT